MSEDLYNGFFVDLFVRASNKLAQMMYANLGYIVYRRVLGYYSGEEDAFGEGNMRSTSRYAVCFDVDLCAEPPCPLLTFRCPFTSSSSSFLSDSDMRRALRRDKKKESVVPLTRPITPDELEW